MVKIQVIADMVAGMPQGTIKEVPASVAETAIAEGWAQKVEEGKKEEKPKK